MANKAKISDQFKKAREGNAGFSRELALFFANAGKVIEKSAVSLRKSGSADGKFKVADRNLKAADGKFKVADRNLKAADGKFKVADGKFKVANRKFKVADRKFKVADRKFKVADRKFKVADRKMNHEAGKSGSGNINLPVNGKKTGSSNKNARIFEEAKAKFMIFAAGFIYNADNYLHYSNNIVYDNDLICTAIKLIDLATEASCIINKIFIIPLRKDRAFRDYGRFDEEAAGAFDGVIILYCGVPP